MAHQGEPQQAEARERQQRIPELAPDSVLFIRPGVDGVIEHHQRANRPEQSDYLNEVTPYVPAITEHFEMRTSIKHKHGHRHDEEQIQRKNDPHD